MTLLSLPNEVLEAILSKESLSALDLLSTGKCCHRLHELVVSSSSLWKKKAFDRWQVWLSSHRLDWPWYEVYKYRHTWHNRMHQLVVSLLYMQRDAQLISADDMGEFLELAEEARKEAGLGNGLMESLAEFVEGRDSDESLKYFGRQAQTFLLRHQLTQCFVKFLQRPEDSQHLEEGALLIARYENISSVVPSYHSLSSELDNIARQVVACLEKTSPPKTEGEACAASFTAAHRQASSLLPAHLSGQCSWSILKAVNHVLFEELKFHGNVDDYYSLRNSFIHQVILLRTGIPITLSILHVAVARRLGVTLVPVNFPRHFHVKFKHSRRCTCGVRFSARGEDPEDDNEWIFIDSYDNGHFRSARECLESLPDPSPSNLAGVPPVEVFVRMLRNISEMHRHMSLFLQTGLEDLFYTLQFLCAAGSLRHSRDDLPYQMLFIQISLEWNVNLNEVIGHCESCIKTLEEIGERQHIPGVKQHMSRAKSLLCERASDEAKRRAASEENVHLRSKHPEVEYHVGMIMHHHRFDYVCAIYGWDETCKQSDEWKAQMGVDQLTHQGDQPFYHVLVEDGSQRYASQESLQLPTKFEHYRPNPNKEVGRYFKNFKNYFYEPNLFSKSCYPEDALCVEAARRTETEAALMDLIKQGLQRV